MIRQKPEKTGTLALDKIRIDGGTQMRADLNEDVVAEYEAIIRDGKDFDPVVVFFDGSKHWLADGFHRFFAYQKAGAIELPADVREGTKRDAILYSVGANAKHGLRRTNADKRRAVETLLSDKEWSAWSQSKIAEACGVSQQYVSKLATERGGDASYNSGKMKTVERNGTTYQQNTENIGKGRPAGVIAEVEKMLHGSALDTAEYRERIGSLSPNDQVQAARRDLSRENAAQAERLAEERQRIAAERAAVQAENDRWHEEQRAAKPEHIRQAEALRDAAIAKRRETAEAADDDGLTDEQRVAELREHIKVVEAENVALKAENVKFEAMRVEFAKGGFEEVVAGKDEALRVAREQLQLENDDKVAWMKKAKHWKKEAERLGWKPDVKIVGAEGLRDA